ncbi:hydrogenase formation protein HypD [Anaerobacillus sp. CMMVII]|uniref:hydrogenase formation protein HypD n=1 Tax=Anaerobacillus sp. CMMVII TaxID=2755588 RepID=UPI0021B81CA1|nr:hydrogenase formation protein HypD [Anaerobacillus sp. CMMVII]MCT8138977.1 hydrogenase formation protein HypD [Anaerobacillus sp. CMMVII]
MLETLKQFSNPEISKILLEKIYEVADRYKNKFGKEPALMEVCGSHTMAVAKTGVKKLLTNHVKLISGPGCPVCVTDQKSIDAMIELSEGENRIICSFGDMIRVPGTKRTLMDAKTDGKDIRIVYSPVDAVKVAKENPNKEVVFLGIGFETTIPVLAVALKMADEENISNFSMWVTTKLVEPILRKLLNEGEVHVDGFLLPGHVSIVLGKDHYQYLADEYRVPGVICGFEPVQLLAGIYQTIKLLLNETPEIINAHRHVVRDKGNPQAQKLMETYFELSHEAWRGIGVIENSGLDIKKEYQHLNAKLRFPVKISEPKKTKCRCGEVIRGLIQPEQCSLFAKACTPTNPIGPCMVSGEGSCAASYQYMRED